jgi:outer membrane protein OmpA-like peptidoglycan-associated protein
LILGGAFFLCRGPKRDVSTIQRPRVEVTIVKRPPEQPNPPPGVGGGPPAEAPSVEAPKTEETPQAQENSKAEANPSAEEAPKADAPTMEPRKAALGMRSFESFLSSPIAGKGTERFELEHLTYDVDSGKLDLQGVRVAAHLADVLKDHPGTNVRIEGYTDDTGSAETNTRLSQVRADGVKHELVSRGIDASRIEAVGEGSADPVASNATPYGRARNRRTEIVVTKK